MTLPLHAQWMYKAIRHMSPAMAIQHLNDLPWRTDKECRWGILHLLRALYDSDEHRERFGFVSRDLIGPITEQSNRLYCTLLWGVSQLGLVHDNADVIRSFAYILPSLRLTYAQLDLNQADDTLKYMEGRGRQVLLLSLLTHGFCFAKSSDGYGCLQEFCDEPEDDPDAGIPIDPDDLAFNTPEPSDAGCSDSAVLMQALLHHARSDDVPEAQGIDLINIMESVLQLPVIKAKLRSYLLVQVDAGLPGDLWSVVCDYVFQHRWAPASWSDSLPCRCGIWYPRTGTEALRGWQHDEEEACKQAAEQEIEFLRYHKHQTDVGPDSHSWWSNDRDSVWWV